MGVRGDMYRFEYTASREDFLRFNEYHLSNSPSGKRTILIFMLILPAIMLLFLILSLINGNDAASILFMVVIYAVISVIWILAVKRMIFRNFRRVIAKMEKEGKMPYGMRTVLQFEEDMMIESTDDTENKVRYSGIEKIGIGSDMIYIYIGAIMAALVPLSAFRNDEEKDEFLRFINGKVAAARKGN
ncbi:MAG: YcxB family protein [Methanomassiliicoccaceae archaeon]|jgi:hypothetical protein|nr:YcxB family protein [Methanomassiliicoccaceae archaeon]